MDHTWRGVCAADMTARVPAQDPTRGREPQAAPETPRRGGDGAAINDLVRELRDELGLAIAPRDLIYSPSQYNNSQADALYNRIKSLYWQEKNALYTTIEECRSDFAEQLSALSAQRRTEYVFQKLSDPAWFTANRVRRPLFRASSDLRRTSSDPRPVQRSFQRVDSGVGTASPGTPSSPLANKTMAEKANNDSRYARHGLGSRRSSTSDATTDTTAKTTPNTSFTPSVKSSAADEGFGGSSVFSQWEDPTPKLPEEQATESIASVTHLGHTPVTRRGSDNVEELTETPKKKVKQEGLQDPETPHSERYLNAENSVK